MPIQIFAVPVEGRFILYRPLLQLAFVGNRAMADLTLDLVQRKDLSGAGRTASDSIREHPPDGGTSEEAAAFLESIGFLEPDPPPPSALDPAFCPTTAVLLLTNRCNLRCIYCYASGGEGPASDLSPALAKAAIDQAYQNARTLDRPHFGLTFHGGGEPMEAWDVVQEATAYARNKDLPCRVTMVSNGVCTPRQREWILNNLDNLSISFDGTQTTQDHQRPFASGQGSFKAVMRTIEALDKADFSYGIRMTATAPWRGQLPKDVRFICEETGCQAMQVEPAFNAHRGEHQGPTQEESEAFVDAFLEAFEIASRAHRRLTYSGARPWLLTRVFCSAPYSALIVNPEGGLVSCYEVTDKNHPLVEMSTLGRVVADQTGPRISIDHGARDALLSFLENRRATCQDCFCFWHCAGDCYTRSLTSVPEDPEATSPRCYMNREITSHILLWYIMNSDGVWRGLEAHPQEEQLLQTF
jgi:uncharacterized protein